LLAVRKITPKNISIFALSGVSGAGRSLKEQNLFSEVAEAMHPYGLAGHRHMPEMEQELSAVAGIAVTIAFIPHLVPLNRGELETITVELAEDSNAADLRACLAARYADEPFVHVLPENIAPATRMVRASNHCVMNVFADRVPGRAIIVSAIDNLVKGSSGQAVQNFNVMFGLPETMGLEQLPLFP
jgi:N-acetyl-gamma-glutamyl-phosphate reductase